VKTHTAFSLAKERMAKASLTMNRWKRTNWLVTLKMLQYALSRLFRVSVLNLHSTGTTWFGWNKKIATAERKEKTKKRKAAEGQLQLKRLEMDKAKASSFVSFCFSKPYNPQGRGRRQTLYISFGANWTFQALCQYQGILALFQRGSPFYLFI